MLIRKLLIFIFVLLLAVGYFPYVAFADTGDKATLGGQDSSGNYHWRINSSGNLIPGTTAQNNIGGTSNKVATVYTGDVNTSTVTASGAMTFLTYLRAVGMGSGDATTLPTSAADAQTPLYRIARVWITTRTLTFANGYAGQLLTLVAEPLSDTGTLTIDATTQFGWSSISMDTVNDTVTLLYVDDTLGWIVAAAQGVTINP